MKRLMFWRELSDLRNCVTMLSRGAELQQAQIEAHRDAIATLTSELETLRDGLAGKKVDSAADVKLSRPRTFSGFRHLAEGRPGAA